MRPHDPRPSPVRDAAGRRPALLVWPGEARGDAAPRIPGGLACTSRAQRPKVPYARSPRTQASSSRCSTPSSSRIGDVENRHADDDLAAVYEQKLSRGRGKPSCQLRRRGSRSAPVRRPKASSAHRRAGCSSRRCGRDKGRYRASSSVVRYAGPSRPRRSRSARHASRRVDLGCGDPAQARSVGDGLWRCSPCPSAGSCGTNPCLEPLLAALPKVSVDCIGIDGAATVRAA